MKTHLYIAGIEWTGNLGEGTNSYTSYGRDHTIQFENKALLQGSSDVAFRGDPSKYNPEELLVSALSTCHMLWYLHLCADAGIIVIAYTDTAKGTMVEGGQEPGKFTQVWLHPHVTITDANKIQMAIELHNQARTKCFIANSVNFIVDHKPEIKVGMS